MDQYRLIFAGVMWLFSRLFIAARHVADCLYLRLRREIKPTVGWKSPLDSLLYATKLPLQAGMPMMAKGHNVAFFLFPLAIRAVMTA